MRPTPDQDDERRDRDDPAHDLPSLALALEDRGRRRRRRRIELVQEIVDVLDDLRRTHGEELRSHRVVVEVLVLRLRVLPPSSG
jgi:hypothetical protein